MSETPVAMNATALMKKTEIMFDAVSTDSVAALKQLLDRTDRQERAKNIADAFNSKAGLKLQSKLKLKYFNNLTTVGSRLTALRK